MRKGYLLRLWNGKVLLALEQGLVVERNIPHVVFRMDIKGFGLSDTNLQLLYGKYCHMSSA